MGNDFGDPIGESAKETYAVLVMRTILEDHCFASGEGFDAALVSFAASRTYEGSSISIYAFG